MNPIQSRQWLTVAIVLIAGCAYSTRATAQNVYKCGDAYSDRPCVGATVLQPGDVRSDAQAEQNREVVARDRKTAVAMEEARLAAEARVGRSGTDGTVGTAGKADARSAGKRREPVAAKAATPGVFIATVPGKPGDPALKKKRKARKKDAPPA